MNIQRRLTVAAAILASFFVRASGQSYLPTTFNTSAGVDNAITHAQTFTVETGGLLASVQLLTQGAGAETVYWELRSVTGALPTATLSDTLASGTVLSSALPPARDWHTFDLTGAAINVTVGQTLSFGLRGSSGNTTASFYGNSTDPYAGGSAVWGTISGSTISWSQLSSGTVDWGFQVAVVPEPAVAAWVTGLAALLISGWRVRRPAGGRAVHRPLRNVV